MLTTRLRLRHPGGGGGGGASASAGRDRIACSGDLTKSSESDMWTATNGHKRSGTECWGVAEQALSVPSGAFGSFPLRECLRHESSSRARGTWTRRPRPFGAPPPALIRPSVPCAARARPRPLHPIAEAEAARLPRGQTVRRSDGRTDRRKSGGSQAEAARSLSGSRPDARRKPPGRQADAGAVAACVRAEAGRSLGGSRGGFRAASA